MYKRHLLCANGNYRDKDLDNNNIYKGHMVLEIKKNQAPMQYSGEILQQNVDTRHTYYKFRETKSILPSII